MNEVRDFDWSGAPEGERWLLDGSAWVITEDGAIQRSDGDHLGWFSSPDGVAWVRRYAHRVKQPARPVPREASSSEAADHRLSGRSGTPTINVDDRVRATLVFEGTISTVTALGAWVIADGGEELFVHYDTGNVEVLQRTDPPLNPGDLVKDADGWAWAVLETNDEGLVFRHVAGKFSNRYRDELTGPLVKVQLTEVQP